LVTTVTTDRPLRVQFDIEPRLAAIPRDNWVKGTFFTGLVHTLGSDFARHEPKLLAPPRLGRYLPFNNYPGVDYSRLLVEAARRRFASVPIGEGLRRLQREAVRAFVESASGRVTMAFVSSFETALLQYPKVQQIILGLDVLAVKQLGPREVVYEFDGYHGWIDCAEIGVVEGIAGYFGADVSIDIDVDPRQYWKGSYRITW
jgi:uncharacterized protein (TIGR02265 family)